VAGISQATLLIEAAEMSGTLITARLTVDYNRELLVVPGSIFSKNSEGVHQFLKLGATPVTTAEDILTALNIDTSNPPTSTIPLPTLSPAETKVFELLTAPLHRDELVRLLNLPVAEVNGILMNMELAGHIIQEQNMYRYTH
jgi:DNA processing protein